MQLSKNFNLVELTKSQTAERKGIPNDPSPDHQENLRLLCERVLQPVRDHFNHVLPFPRAIATKFCQLRSAAAGRVSIALEKLRILKSLVLLIMKSPIGSKRI